MVATPASAGRIQGLTKRYGDRVALDGVDFELAPGELRGLLGPNGAGKTTFLRALFGLSRSTRARSNCWAAHAAPGTACR